MEIKNLRPELEVLIPFAKGIVATVGKNCEVVIHDLETPESSLVYIAGNVTNRSIGAPITNLVLETLRTTGDKSEDLICYQTVTRDGKVLKSSTMFIRDKSGRIIGCVCINIDLTEFLLCQKIIGQFTEFPGDKSGNVKNEFFARDVNEVIENLIKHVVDNSKVPVALMQKEDKIQIVHELDKKGVFLVKGSVEQVASMLGVSRYTIYNYLEETRFKQQ